MATAFDQFESIIHENIGNAVVDLRQGDLDDPMELLLPIMKPLGQGGRRASGADGYEASVKLKLTRGGTVEGAPWGGSDTKVTTTAGLQVGYDSATFPGIGAYPDPLKSPRKKYQTITAILKRLKGLSTVDMEQVLADVIASSLEEVAMSEIEDIVFQVRTNLYSWFYSDGSSMIAKAGASGTIAAALGASVGFTITDGTLRRFIQGQRYELYQSSGWPGTKTLVANGTELVADYIDYQATSGSLVGKLALTRDGAGTVSVSVGDILVKKGTVSGNNSLVPVGIEYMFKTSGEFFGVADVATVPQLQGWVQDFSSSPVQPEPDVITKQFDIIRDSGQPIPTLIISERALQSQYAYLEKAGYAHYVVPQVMPRANGGISGAVFSYGPTVVPWEVSAFIRPGMLWATDPETLRKFMPGNEGAVNVRWVNARGEGAGISPIYKNVTSGSQQTELWQAPFDYWCEFMTDNPQRNLLMKGLLTQKTA